MLHTLTYQSFKVSTFNVPLLDLGVSTQPVDPPNPPNPPAFDPSPPDLKTLAVERGFQTL